MSIRILLVDDHNVVRQGVRSLLEGEEDLEVVGEAEDGATAARLARELLPDVVTMDISMRGMNGIEATRQILRKAPSARVLALSMHPEARFVLEVLRAGASGYLLKSCPYEELLAAIRTVAEGQTYLSAAIAGVVVQGCLSRGAAPPSSAFATLTEREREVLGLVAEGLATKQIAARLHLSVKTIEMHRGRIMDRLGIRSVAGLTKYAIREGLTTLDG